MGNISEEDLKVIRLLLGEDVAREFKEFVQKRKGTNRAQRVRVRNRRQNESKEKEFVIDVSKFKERDLRGWLEYDEAYFDDEYFWKPEWLESLERVCKANENQRYVVVFKGIENASDRIYTILKKFKETGKIFDEDYNQELPSNARFGKVELPERTIVTVRRDKDRDKDKDKSHDNSGGIFIDYNEYDVLR